MGVDGSLVLKYDLKIGTSFTVTLKQDLENNDRLEMAYTKLLNFIAYRERCEFEVNQWLFKKGYFDLEEELITRLKDKNYLSDARYAKLFVRDRVKLKGWGPIRLRHELASKRVAKGIIEREIDSIRDDFDFDKMAIEHVSRKLKHLKVPTYKDKKRLWSLLQRRGYESSSIAAALSNISFSKDEDI